MITIEDIISTLDKNHDGKVEWYEYLVVILLLIFLVLYYIIFIDLDILVILKQSNLFIVLLALIIIYSVLFVREYESLVKRKEATNRDTMYLYFNIFHIVICSFGLMYILFVKYL
jgi:hypothetical protein